MQERSGTRAEQLRTRRQEASKLEREIKDSFQNAERHRLEIESTIVGFLDEKMLLVLNDVHLEANNR